MGSSFNLQNTIAKKRYVPKNTKHEENIQLAVCNYLRLQYPHVTFRSDYASGLKLTLNQAAKHKRLQSGKSWPDLFIYAPMVHGDKTYYGLALELKKDGTTVILKTGKRKGHLSTEQHIQEQAVMLKELNRLGYYANFAVGFDQAKRFIDWYFKKPTTEQGQIF